MGTSQPTTNSAELAAQIKEHFSQLTELLMTLPQEELLKIRFYAFGEQFAWWDRRHFYEDQPPMSVGNVEMDHPEAMYLQLMLAELLDFDAFGERDVSAFYRDDD